MTTRRSFLRTALAGGSMLGIEGLIVRGLGACRPAPRSTPGAGGYGELRPRQSENTGETLLALPEGFHYTVFGKTGEQLSDGRITPPDHDGMAVFAHRGKLRLIRNHECSDRRRGNRAIGDPARSYDPAAPGGTVTLEIDRATRLPTSQFISLSGTLINCAGGPTPWGSWISCEETTSGPAQSRSLTRDHGYCFEVPVDAEGEVTPVALTAMGRFTHEAVAVDPATGIVYETEDATPAGFYRFIPRRKEHLAAGGRLEMLAVERRPGYDTRTEQQVGAALPVRWVPIDDPDPDMAGTNPASVHSQGAARGGATFGRLEGCWYGGGNIYLNATNGGDAKLGQVWQYRPRGEDTGELTLLFESRSRVVLKSPDNLCVSPRGGLVLCEDGGEDNFVRGLTRDGRLFGLCQNLNPENGEFAGATFSPDGETLFVNVQRPGYTLAVWGDWEAGEL